MPDEIRVYVVNDPTRTNLRLKYVDPVTGKAHWKTAKTGEPEAAIKAAGVWQAELNSGVKTKSQGRLPWKEFVDVCKQERISALASRTQSLYLSILDSITRTVHPATIGHLSSQMISKWQSLQRTAKVAEATIESRSAMLQSMLNWAVDQKYISECPKFAKIVRSRTGKKAKGRPLLEPEFQLMLDKTAGIVGGEELAIGWKRSMRGLWFGGLRLSEAIDLSWDEPDRLQVDVSEMPPVLKIFGEREKGGEDRMLPLAPEFGKWLLEIPPHQRTGPVFSWPRQRQRVGKADPTRPTLHWVSAVISAIGEAAGILVKQNPKKFASAHDFRRSFAERWRRKVEPQVLMEMMRHEDFQTTRDYYSEQNSRRTGAELWEKFGNLGSIFGSTPPNNYEPVE